MLDELLKAAITIVFGAIAGGLTNTVAIWMLFHPYEPVTFLGRRIHFLQGAIPKSQERLAAAIGRTVGNRLLTEDDLLKIFSEPEFRAAFDERLSGFLASVLDEERGSLRELLPPGLVSELDPMVEGIVDRGVGRLREYLASDAFEEVVVERLDSVIERIGGDSIGDILTPAREVAITAAVDEWLSGAITAGGFERAVSDYLERAARSVLTPERTFEEILPGGLVVSLEKSIQGYLPLAIERLGGLLDDPETRGKFERGIHDILHRFLNDLKFHQRVVAKLVINESTVDKVLDTIESEGAERLSEMLREPGIQAAMARGVNEAIVEFLQRPVRSVLGDPEDEAVVDALGTARDWVMNLARDPATREFVIEKLERALEKTSERSWGDLLKRVPRERLAEWIVSFARSEPAEKIFAETGARAAQLILERPLGRPADWLPDGGRERLESAMAQPIWEWLQSQVPDVVRQLDVARRVEEKVRHFPVERMEELVRKVTHRELRLIVKLGYVLGAIIGTVLVGVNLLLP